MDRLRRAWDLLLHGGSLNRSPIGKADGMMVRRLIAAGWTWLQAYDVLSRTGCPLAALLSIDPVDGSHIDPPPDRMEPIKQILKQRDRDLAVVPISQPPDIEAGWAELREERIKDQRWLKRAELQACKQIFEWIDGEWKKAEPDVELIFKGIKQASECGRSALSMARSVQAMRVRDAHGEVGETVERINMGVQAALVKAIEGGGLTEETAKQIWEDAREKIDGKPSPAPT